MEYAVGNIGRVFLLRFDDGDDLLGELEALAAKENVRAGWFQLLGGLRKAEVVTGPEAPTMPPKPVWRTVEGAQEILGIGSLFWEGDQPRLYLHAALGHHGETLVSCVRRATRVYLIIEIFLFEIVAIAASRPWDANRGFNRLLFGQENREY